MKRFKKETLLFLVVLVVAVLGLIQAFHEEAYATAICSLSVCSNCNCEVFPNNCNGLCACYTGGPNIRCTDFCAGACGD